MYDILSLRVNIAPVDIGEKFLNADGSMNKELMPDTLHQSEKGYQIWTDAILDTVKKCCNYESGLGSE